MGMLDNFNADEHQDTQAEIMPAGDYSLLVVAYEIKDTKARTGQYLNLQMQVVEGDYEGTCIFELFNLDNPNPIAVKIAKQQLANLCRAIGISNSPKSFEEFLNIPFTATIKIEKGTGEYADKNKIKKYHPLDGKKPAPIKKAPVVKEDEEENPPWI